jgi:hypothetical protein
MRKAAVAPSVAPTDTATKACATPNTAPAPSVSTTAGNSSTVAAT